MGSFAVHRIVLVDRAGDRDEPVRGGVEDDRLLVILELAADDAAAPRAALAGSVRASAAQAGSPLGEARTKSLISPLVAGWRECWALAISSMGSMVCWRAVRITLIVIC
jgi:hypothetical protein